MYNLDKDMKKKIKTKWIIKRLGGEVVVEKGQKVKCGDLILRDNTEVIKCFTLPGCLKNFKKEKIEELIFPLANKHLAKGEMMFKLGGIWGHRIVAPIAGVCVGVDEFSNFMFQVANEAIRDVFSPVDGVIDDIDKDQIVIVFEAFEFGGIGLVEGKVWGNGDLEEIDLITDLSASLDGDILLTNNFEKCFLTKAEVVGVRAFVVLDKESDFEVETTLPVLSLTSKEWEELKKYKDGIKRRFLLNSKIGRLLMVS